MKLTPLRWTLQHGLPRVVMLAAARRNDPVPALVTASSDEDRAHHLGRLRQDGPVSRGMLVSGTASHAAVDKILRSADFGVGEEFAAYPKPLGKLVLASRDPEALRIAEPPSLVALDDPDHGRYRRLVSRAFTPRAIEKMRTTIEETADSLLAEMEGRQHVDLVAAYTERLPIAVISELLGVPEEERDRLGRFGRGSAAALGVAQPFSVYRATDDTVRRFNAWFTGHIERLRKHPGDDLLSGLIADGDLTERELLGIGGLMLNAGFVTTAALLTNAVQLLVAHPDQLSAVMAEPELWPNVVDEVVRIDAPLRVTARTALRDTEVLGEKVASGTRVVLMLDGANLDPAVFADPERFDIRRENARRNLSFAGGAHYCLGATLAKLEGEVGLSRLFERYPHLQTMPGGRRIRTPFLSVWERLPVLLNGRGALPDRHHAAAAAPAVCPFGHGAADPARSAA